MSRRALAIALVALSWATVAAGRADTRIVSEEGTGLVGDAAELPESLRKAFADQQPTTVTYWLRADRMARIGPSGPMIGRLDRGEVYLVDARDETYSVLAIGGDGPPLHGATLVRSGDTRQIGPWKAVRYDLTLQTDGEPTEVTLWVSDEVPVDMAAFRAYTEAFAAASPGFDWMRALLELDGYPVRQEVRIGP
ncbi:MAG TPA: hypothetical protein VMT16_07745, partial [Thermoanaerobaculia bacterium]|nr:hypothetical protein [Thermoanaerobaculia bacterium]